MKTHEVTTCTLCGSRDLARFDVGAGNILQRCVSCGAVCAPLYADPSEVYTDGYMFGETDFGLDVRDPIFQAFLMEVAHLRMAIIERRTGGRGTLLDVGSGTGEMLEAARDRGWRVQGVEPERTAAAMAQGRGVDVQVAMLEDSGVPQRSWDVVSAFHVLEHVPDPPAFLRTLARWARPGGHVVVEAPNFASRQRRQRREGWVHLRPLEHITHFTPATMEATLRTSGLEPVAIRSPSWVHAPQTLEQALWDLARGWRYERLLKLLSSPHRVNGELVRRPGRAAWAVLRALDALYDRRGVGSVVLGIGRLALQPVQTGLPAQAPVP